MHKESTTTSSSYSDNNNDQDQDFECNICFELTQDPIVTLCGHLFCWPCLYRWLHHHSQCQECPVCKAIVQEDKLVPLYGRGKNHTDPRSKHYPGMHIPNRPAGQRPETATRQGDVASNFFNFGIGLMGGFMPMATTRIGGFSISVGGLLPALLNSHFHGFPAATLYGSTPGYGHGEERNNQLPMARRDAAKHLFLIVGFCVLIMLIW